jgi:predicted metalloendopeptidase
MLCKNLPFSELLWKLPFRLALDAISAWKGLLSGDGYFFTAIVKAHFAVFGRLITGQIKRSKATKSLKLLNGVYAESLVFQYFIKKKQHFKKIVH